MRAALDFVFLLVTQTSGLRFSARCCPFFADSTIQPFNDLTS
jgi:hypothetical protein